MLKSKFLLISLWLISCVSSTSNHFDYGNLNNVTEFYFDSTGKPLITKLILMDSILVNHFGIEKKVTDAKYYLVGKVSSLNFQNIVILEEYDHDGINYNYKLIIIDSLLLKKSNAVCILSNSWEASECMGVKNAYIKELILYTQEYQKCWDEASQKLEITRIEKDSTDFSKILSK